MSDKYKYTATVTLVVEVKGEIQDDTHTVLEQQIRDQAIDDAGLMFRDEDIDVNGITYKPIDPIYDDAVTIVRGESISSAPELIEESV